MTNFFWKQINSRLSIATLSFFSFPRGGARFKNKVSRNYKILLKLATLIATSPRDIRIIAIERNRAHLLCTNYFANYYTHDLRIRSQVASFTRQLCFVLKYNQELQLCFVRVRLLRYATIITFVYYATILNVIRRDCKFSNDFRDVCTKKDRSKRGRFMSSRSLTYGLKNWKVINHKSIFIDIDRAFYPSKRDVVKHRHAKFRRESNGSRFSIHHHRQNLIDLIFVTRRLQKHGSKKKKKWIGKRYYSKIRYHRVIIRLSSRKQYFPL